MNLRYKNEKNIGFRFTKINGLRKRNVEIKIKKKNQFFLYFCFYQKFEFYYTYF